MDKKEDLEIEYFNKIIRVIKQIIEDERLSAKEKIRILGVVL